MKVKKAVILAGGLGTRFLPASKAIPKEMFPVLDKPILQYLVEELTKAGIEEVVIVLGKHKELVIKHFRDDKFLEERLKQTKKPELLQKLTDIKKLCKITFVKNVAPKGAGYALLKAKKHLKNEPFILLVGDEIGVFKDKNSVEQLLDAYEKFNKNIVGVSIVPKHEMVFYGMLDGEKLDDTNFLVNKMVEKPKIIEVTSNLPSVGKYIFEPSVFNIMQKVKREKNKEMQYNDAILEYIKEKNVIATVINYKRYDTGSKLGFIKANLDLALKDDEINKDLMLYLNDIVKEGEI